MCNFLPVYIQYFLQAVTLPYFTSKTLNKDQKIEQLFYSLLVFVLQLGDVRELHGSQLSGTRFSHAEKSASQKGGTNWFYATDFHNSNAIL